MTTNKIQNNDLEIIDLIIKYFSTFYYLQSNSDKYLHTYVT